MRSSRAFIPQALLLAVLAVSTGCFSEPPTRADSGNVALGERVEAIRALRDLEVQQGQRYADALQSIESFRVGIAQVPVPDTGGTSEAARRRNRLLFRDSIARQLLSQAAEAEFYYAIRSGIAEEMMRMIWMNGIARDTLSLYYLRHAIAGYSPDTDRIVQTLARLDVSSETKAELAKDALLNLRAYEVLLTEWAALNPDLADRVALSNGEAISTADYLASVADNESSLELYLVGGSR